MTDSVNAESADNSKNSHTMLSINKATMYYYNPCPTCPTCPRALRALCALRALRAHAPKYILQTGKLKNALHPY